MVRAVGIPIPCSATPRFFEDRYPPCLPKKRKSAVLVQPARERRLVSWREPLLGLSMAIQLIELVLVRPDKRMQ